MRELVGDGNGVVVGPLSVPFFQVCFSKVFFFPPDLLFFGGKGPTGPPIVDTFA